MTIARICIFRRRKISRYTDTRVKIRKELDNFFKLYPELIRLIDIEDEYLPFKAFTFTPEERIKILRKGIDSSSIVPWIREDSEVLNIPIHPEHYIPIIKVPSLKDTRKRELRKAGYPLGIYIILNDRQNLDWYILSRYQKNVYIPNKLFWDNLDFVDKDSKKAHQEAHLFSRGDGITLTTIENGSL